MNKSLIIAVASCFVQISSFAQSNSNGDFLTTKNGLQYKVISHQSSAQRAKTGDIVKANVHLYIEDSLISEFFPATVKVPPIKKRSESLEGFMLLGVGDSGIFRVSIDTLKKYSGQSLPPFMTSGKHLYYYVKIMSIQTQEEAKAEAKNTEAKEKASDEKTLNDYFASHNIKATKTASGIYYTTEAEGSGEKILPGKTVSIKYVGKTLDGKVFDANTGPDAKHNNEFSFMVGRGDVIPGMEEGVLLMKKGGKSTIYIPSELGYGADGAGDVIPPYAVLIFEVEITDVK